jgi:hypothetical protein
MRGSVTLGLVLVALTMLGCQSPTDPDETVNYDEVVDATASPDPIVATETTESTRRTYRVVRGNNQPDEILPYDWHTVFSTTLTFNSKATDKDVDVEFPVRIASTALSVKQATNGIITAPTGSEREYYEFVTLSATGNQVSGVGNPITLTFEVWYDLPSLRKEAVITVAITFEDDDGVVFQKTEDFRVSP